MSADVYPYGWTLDIAAERPHGRKAMTQARMACANVLTSGLCDIIEAVDSHMVLDALLVKADRRC